MLAAFISGVYRYKHFDVATKILCVLIGLTFFNELIAFYAAVKYHNNIPIYDVFGIIEFVMLSLYFNYSIDIFRKYSIGIYIGVIGALLGIANAVFLQPLQHLNTYFLFFDGICVTSMVLYSFVRLVQKYDDLEYKYYPHFWIGLCYAFFWSSTSLNWGLYDQVLMNSKVVPIISIFILLVNIITYAGIGIIFWLFPKMQKKWKITT